MRGGTTTTEFSSVVSLTVSYSRAHEVPFPSSRIPLSLVLRLYHHGRKLPGTPRPRCPFSRCDNRPRKISLGKYRLRSPHSAHSATIHVSGSVPTGAGIFSPHPLHRTVKSQIRAGSGPNMSSSIGEQKAKIIHNTTNCRLPLVLLSVLSLYPDPRPSERSWASSISLSP